MRWLTVQLRRLADARAATAGLIGLALVTSFLFAAAPRVIDAQADQALRSTVDSATSDARNLAVSQTGRISKGSPDPLAEVSATGDQLGEQFPSSVHALVRARYMTVDTARFVPLTLGGRTVRLRYLEGAVDHVRFVSGRSPTGQTSQLPVPPGTLVGRSTTFGGSLPPPDSLTTFEVALSSASAHNLNVGIGDRLELRTDETDKLAASSVSYVAIEVVGIFDVPDGSADYWFGDATLERPQIRSLSSTNQIDDVTALISADAYPALMDATLDSRLPLRYTWRYQIDSARLRADNAAALLTDLRRMESVFLASGTSSPNPRPPSIMQLSPPTLQSGLRRLLEIHAGGWRAVTQILSVAEVGCGAVALLALSLVCLLAGRRRASSLATWQSRGASRLRAVGGALVDVVLELAVPAAAGAALAVALIPSRPLAPSLAAAGAVLGFATCLMMADAWGASGDPAGDGRGTEGGRGLRAVTRGAGPRRLVLEGIVVAAAVIGAFVLRQRGVASAGNGVVLGAPDPLLAAVPALIGGAAALVAARLLPIPMDLLARLAQRGRGLVALLALRRATRRTSDRMLLTALLAMTAVWSFAAVSLAYLERASDASSWQSVGASYRISVREGSLPPDLHLAGVTGVEAMSTASLLNASSIRSTAPIPVLALDLAAYRDVVKGGPQDGVVPQSMIDAEATPPAASPLAPAGSSAAPIPAIVSSLAARIYGWHVGDTFQLNFGQARPWIAVATIRATFPTLTADTGWLVVAHNLLAAAVPGSEVAPNEVFIRAGPDAAAGIAKEVADHLPGEGTLTSRFDASADIRNAPDYVAVAFGLAAASFVVAAYGALAIFVALLLSGAEQSRESAHLRVLGLSRGENIGLSAMEHGPVSLVVIFTGIALGAGLFAFLQSSLGLGRLVGGDIDVGLPIEAVQVATIFGAICAIVALAVLLETVAESIINPTAALRRGIE